MRVLKKHERILIAFKRKEMGINLENCAKTFSMSKSNLSRIENGKTTVSKPTIERFESYYDIDLGADRCHIEEMENKFKIIYECIIQYQLFEKYSKEWLEEPESIKRTCLYPMYILGKVFVAMFQVDDEVFIKKYTPIFDDLIGEYDVFYQRTFYVARASYFYRTARYHEALEILDYLDEHFEHDDLFDSVFYHLKAMCISCVKGKDETLELLIKAIHYNDRTNNMKRLTMCWIMMGAHRRLERNYEAALECDLLTLERIKYLGFEQCYMVIYNNIAWNYYLLGRYKESYEYYLLCETYEADSDIYFMLALLNYRFKHNEQARQYIVKGRSCKNKRSESFSYLLDWLEYMMNKRFSKKAEKVLLQCLNKCEFTIHTDSRNHIYHILKEHYRCTNNMKEYERFNDLINQSSSGPIFNYLPYE